MQKVCPIRYFWHSLCKNDRKVLRIRGEISRNNEAMCLKVERNDNMTTQFSHNVSVVLASSREEAIRLSSPSVEPFALRYA